MPRFTRLTGSSTILFPLGRTYWVRLCASICWLFTLSLATHAKQPVDPFVVAGADDASLNAVCAPSPDRVWAVGDRGVIWATADGGRKWVRQESGTSANLHAVLFKNSSEGCAVGGLPGAMSRTSRGVILRTVNGGETWTVTPSEGLPRFTGMRMIGGRLIAWGDYCPQRKTGIFYSVNDGQTWQALDSSLSHIAGLGADASGNVVAVDRVGNAFNTQLGLTRSFFTTSPHQPIAFVEHVGSTWLAGGADGQLLRTVDAQSWNRVALPLSAAAQRVCQWRSLAQFEDQLWIAGSPGSIVLHSADRGMTWDIQSTEQTLPLRSIVFADAQRGWAVGPLGSIIATRDGGRTWYSQKKMATRVGLLAVTASESQVPWPVLVASSWDELVATKSVSLFGENLEQSADYLQETWKLNEALAPQLGLAEHSGWLHPKPTELSQQDLSLLVDRLVVELQCWRPDVVLTDETGGRKLSLVNRAAMAALTAAIQQAANANTPSISKELMLPAWRTTKLATVTEARGSQYSEHPNRLMREPGLSIWDVLAPMGVVYDANARTLNMRTIQQAHSTLASNTSLFGGVAPSQTSRRQINLRSLGNYQLIMGRVHRMLTLDKLVSLPSETPLLEWQTQLDFVLRSLPPREVAPALVRVVNACSVPALWQRRQLALERLIQLQPDSDTASHARMTLLQMLSSDELRAWSQNTTTDPTGSQSVGSLRNDPGNALSRSASSLTPFDTVPASATKADAANTARNASVVTGAKTDASSQVSVATFVTPASETASETVSGSAAPKKSTTQQSDLFFQTLDSCYKSDLYLANLPQLELMRDAISRERLGNTRGASMPNGLLESIAGLNAIAGWPQVAKQELLLANDHPEQLRWVGFAVATATRPLLDGVLDEPMWSACPPMKLTRANQNSTNGTETPALVRWSFDDRYLYIAIDSPREDRSNLNRAPKLRKYDSDLEAADHIHFVLDTDRDYASAIELGVSSEGETFDRCCGITQYNPQYAVAVPDAPLPERWVAEIAIPISDLTTKADLTSQAWAVSAHRRSLRGETQSWSSMLSDQPSLQSAGILLFVQPPER
ncbi:MAG: YCF48-related protein [Pirellulaceae bacterium]|nr:YCF48-related protein [Pirellulaceae bacterium]